MRKGRVGVGWGGKELNVGSIEYTLFYSKSFFWKNIKGKRKETC